MNDETQSGSLSFPGPLNADSPLQRMNAVWNKSPRLDAALSRKMDLAFEDMGLLADPIDKRMDSLLKKCHSGGLQHGALADTHNSTY